jgi:hypothetical protein
MTIFARLLTAAAVTAATAAPLAAQYPYPYPTPYPTPYPGTTYPYGGGGTVLGQVLDQLLGGRYAANDRTAIQQCASAAVAQAANQYRPYGAYGGGYGTPYGGYNPYAANIRVTAITEVERRSDGVRVRGLLDSGMGYSSYNPYTGPTYSGSGDLTFRCMVDYRGYVRDVRVRRR